MTSHTPPLPSSVSSPEEEKQQPMQLFRHQVGGHFPLICNTDGTVCKPADPRELEFYINLNADLPAMIPFVPKYHGYTYIERPSDLPYEDGDSDSSQEESISDGSRRKRRTLNEPQYNAWSRELNTKRREQLAQKIKYIILENLAYPYTMPNILDLKLGVRQHGLEDSPDKVNRKRLRCAMSTSAALGLRAGGMQSYRPLEGKYLFRDKYYGRALNKEQFFQTLQEFFSDGQNLLKDVITEMLTRLREFYKTIQNETRYRFYSSSLLLVFEGLPVSSSPEEKDKDKDKEKEKDKDNKEEIQNPSQTTSKKRRVDLRMIDFARTWKVPEGDDDGILKGCESLIIYLGKLLLLDGYGEIYTLEQQSKLTTISEEQENKKNNNLSLTTSTGTSFSSSITSSSSSSSSSMVTSTMENSPSSSNFSLTSTASILSPDSSILSHPLSCSATGSTFPNLLSQHFNSHLVVSDDQSVTPS